MLIEFGLGLLTSVFYDSIRSLSVHATPTMPRLIHDVLQEWNRSTPKIFEGEDAELAGRMLSSQAGRICVRRLVALRLVGELTEQHAAKIQEAFFIDLDRIEEFRHDELRINLFEILTDASEVIVEAIHESPERKAITEEFTNAHLISTMESIDDQIRALRALQRASQGHDPVAMESAVRQAIIDRYSELAPPQIQGKKYVPIDDLYVPPRLRRPTATKEQHRDAVALPRLMQTCDRVVVLGDPGGGKSTLAGKIALELAKNSDYVGKLELIPLFVILRDYDQSSRQRPLSIVDFITESLESDYQVIGVTQEWIKEVLSSGRAFVIFDGLDELTDTSRRTEIVRKISSFVTAYPLVRNLVTSRSVGYEEAPLPSRHFEKYYLSPFDMDQVIEYVGKWFSNVAGISEAKQRELTAAFLQESEIAFDIRGNPLMLALMCGIYRDERYIPSNRPDLYRRCSHMLYEKWDQQRGLRDSLKVDPHVPHLLSHIAANILEEGSGSGVTREYLVSVAANYLHPRRFEDRVEAEAAGREFFDHCAGRAWVFSDVGSLSSGEPLYAFTHRTFLEFYAAEFLARRFPSADDLYAEISPRIEAREWDVIAQMAIHIVSSRSEDAADRFVGLLCESTSDEQEGFSAKIDFASRSLEFLVPSPSLVRVVVRRVASHFFFVGESLRLFRDWSEDEEEHLQQVRDVVGGLAALLACHRANMSTVIDELAKVLDDALESPTADVRDLAFLAVAGLPSVPVGYIGVQGGSSASASAWRDVQLAMIERHAEIVDEVCRNHLFAAVWSVMHGFWNLRALIEAHGSMSLLVWAGFPFFSRPQFDMLSHAGVEILAADQLRSPGQSLRVPSWVVAVAEAVFEQVVPAVVESGGPIPEGTAPPVLAYVRLTGDVRSTLGSDIMLPAETELNDDLARFTLGFIAALVVGRDEGGPMRFAPVAGTEDPLEGWPLGVFFLSLLDPPTGEDREHILSSIKDDSVRAPAVSIWGFVMDAGER